MKEMIVMTVPEVAKSLQLSRSKVYALIERRELPAVRIGRNVRVLGSDLERWLEAQRQGQLGQP